MRTYLAGLKKQRGNSVFDQGLLEAQIDSAQQDVERLQTRELGRSSEIRSIPGSPRDNLIGLLGHLLRQERESDRTALMRQFETRLYHREEFFDPMDLPLLRETLDPEDWVDLAFELNLSHGQMSLAGPILARVRTWEEMQNTVPDFQAAINLIFEE